MAGSWGTVLTVLVPLGLVISLSPLTVIPAVLVLQAPRPRPSSLAFLAGWLLWLAALTALSVAASGLLGGLDKSPPKWSSWLRVVLGAALSTWQAIRATRAERTAMAEARRAVEPGLFSAKRTPRIRNGRSSWNRICSGPGSCPPDLARS